MSVNFHDRGCNALKIDGADCNCSKSLNRLPDSQYALENQISQSMRIMLQSDYLIQFDKICSQMVKLTKNKNTDYAGAGDAFANFRQIEILTKGKVSVEEGILVRMTDKLARIANLLQNPAKVSSESTMDTLTDLAVYSIILRIYLEHKLNETSDRLRRRRGRFCQFPPK